MCNSSHRASNKRILVSISIVNDILSNRKSQLKILIRTKGYSKLFLFFFFFLQRPPAATEPNQWSQSFTVLLIKSCPALWPYCPTSHAFSGGIWSEIRQESTETSLTLLLPYAAHPGKRTGWGTGWSLACDNKSLLNEKWSSVSCGFFWRRHKSRPLLQKISKRDLNHWDALIAYKFYKSCLYDKLITLSLTAAHSEGRKGAGLRGDGP